MDQLVTLAVVLLLIRPPKATIESVVITTTHAL